MSRIQRITDLVEMKAEIYDNDEGTEYEEDIPAEYLEANEEWRTKLVGSCC